MERKAVSGIMLTLLLTNMLVLAFNVQPGKEERPRDGNINMDWPSVPAINGGFGKITNESSYGARSCPKPLIQNNVEGKENFYESHLSSNRIEKVDPAEKTARQPLSIYVIIESMCETTISDGIVQIEEKMISSEIRDTITIINRSRKLSNPLNFKDTDKVVLLVQIDDRIPKGEYRIPIKFSCNIEVGNATTPFSMIKDAVINLPLEKNKLYVNFIAKETDYVEKLFWHSIDGTSPTSFNETVVTPEPFELQLVDRIEAPVTGRIYILVNEFLYSEIQSHLDQYLLDVVDAGYSVGVYTTLGGTPEDIRSFLQGGLSDDLVGCLLIGDVPEPWYEMYGCWGGYNEEFPMDLFYMDLDGMWMDFDNDGIYDRHRGDIAPEIWVGRLKASNIDGDEVSLINNYFEKNHRYRNGEITVPRRALIYIDDDWTSMADSVNSSLGEIYYGTTDVIVDGAITTAEDYKSRIAEGYEWVHLQCHGWPGGHTFKIGSNWTGGTVYSSDYRLIDPPAFFYQLFVCSGARYVEPNYLAGSCIFTDNYGLLAIGSTKTGSMLYFSDFYRNLAEGDCIGKAFRRWFIEYGGTSPCWFYGLSIIGDPTLIPASQIMEHDLAVSLETPVYLLPGSSCLLNATVSNYGLENESDVAVQLLVNGSVVLDEVIPVLLNGNSTTLSHSWTPTTGWYSITAYVQPVAGENWTRNNYASEWVDVSTNPRHVGDIVVEDDEVFIIEDMYFTQTGNIFVRDHATLVVRNATLNLNQKYWCQYQISVGGSAVFRTRDAFIVSDKNFYIRLEGSAEGWLNSTYFGYDWSIPPTISTGHIYVEDDAVLTVSNSTLFRLDCMGYSLVSVVECDITSWLYISYWGSSEVSLIGSTVGCLSIGFSSSSRASLAGLNFGHIGFWNIHMNETVSGVDWSLTLVDTKVTQDWHLSCYVDSVVLVYDSTLSYLYCYDDSVVLVYNSAVNYLYARSFVGTIYFDNVTLKYSWNNYDSQYYVYGNISFVEKAYVYVRYSNLTRNYNVQVFDADGSPMENVFLGLLDFNGSLMWSGYTDSSGRAYFNLTFTDSNYTDILRLEAMKDDYYAKINVRLLSNTPISVLVQVLPDILIVDDNDGSFWVNGTSLPEFESALTNAGYYYVVWNTSSWGNPSIDFLSKFKLVIWTCGDYWSEAVDPVDAATLESYIASGGSILLEGEDIGYDHRADGFMVNVAHALYRVDNTGAPGLTVTKPTHPVVNGLPSNFIWAIDPPYEDGVAPTNIGMEVIQYTGTSWTAVTVFEGTVSKVVYLAFPLYCLGSPEQETLAVNSVNWLLEPPREFGWVESKGVCNEPVSERRPSMATDSNGHLYVAYEHYNPDSGFYEIYVSKSMDNGDTCSVIGYVYDDHNLGYPSIAIDIGDNSNIFVAFEREWTSTDYDIFVLRYVGGSWHVSSVANTLGSNDRYPSITSEYQYGTADRQYISYEYVHSPDDRDLMFAKSEDDGATWSKKKLHGGFPDWNVHCQTSITTTRGSDGNDYIYIAYKWGADYNMGYDVVIDKSNDRGDTWTQQWVCDESSRDKNWPSITATHGGGTVVIAWHVYWDSVYLDDIQYAYSTNNGDSWNVGWLALEAYVNEETPTLTVDGQDSTSTSIYGCVHAVYWRDNDIYCRETLFSSPWWWTPAEAVTDTAAYVSAVYTKPAITTYRSAGGRYLPTVAWTDLRNGSYDIYYSTKGPMHTIHSNPPERTVEVDGEPYTAPVSFYWIEGSTHTINVSSPQYVSSDVRYVFENWSDGGAQSHIITAGTSDQNIMAYFKVQYYLSVTTNPSELTPQPIITPSGPWYANGTLVNCSAQDVPGYTFDHWTVDETNQGQGINPIPITMDEPHTAIAHYLARDIAVTNVTPSKTAVAQSYSLSINVTIENQGDATETFNVTAYADKNVTVLGDEIIIGNQNVSNLAPGTQRTLTFTWNTTKVTPGNYTISAQASTVPDEADTTDNTKVDGSVVVTHTQFTLSTLYEVNLNVNEIFDYGGSLKVQFYSYSGVYQGEVTVWIITTPGYVTLSANASHPLNWPIENATLVLTDDLGNILQTVTSFVVHRPDLMVRLGELDYLWTVPGADRTAIMKEYVAIDGQWPYAPP